MVKTGLGGFIGVFLGSLLVWSNWHFGWLKITPSLSYPVGITVFINVLFVFATIIVIGIIASLIASVESIRNLIGTLSHQIEIPEFFHYLIKSFKTHLLNDH